MKFSKRQKKFIRQNYKKLTTQELAKELNVKEKHIKKFLKKSGKEIKIVADIREKLTTVKSLSDIKNILKKNASFVLILMSICWLVYLNALQGEFVSDDLPSYVQNPSVTSWALALKDPHLRLQLIIYVINYKLFQLNPVPLHMISLSFHTVATVLVFIFAYLTFGKKISIITSLLFAVHPVNTEAVIWLSAVNYLTNAVVTLTTFIFYILYKNSRNKKYLTTGLIVYTIGSVAIRNAFFVTTPFLLVILDQFILEEKIAVKSLIINVLPFFIATTIYFAIDFGPLVVGRIVYVQNLQHNVGDQLPLTTTAPYTILMALKLLIFPKDLTFYHEGEYIRPFFFTFGKFVILVSPLILGYLWKYQRKIAGSIIIIFLSLLPSFSPVQVAWYIAERYLYLGAAFFCIILAYTLIKLETKLELKHFALTVTAILFLIYSIRTLIRNAEWRTPKKLWLATSKVAADSPRVYNNLGDSYSQEKDYPRAIASFRKALEINPQYADVIHNLGRTYLLMGDLDSAEKYFRVALAVKPDIYQTYYTLGLIEHRRGNIQKAKAYFYKSLEINPTYQDSLKALEIIEKNPN